MDQQGVRRQLEPEEGSAPSAPLDGASHHSSKPENENQFLLIFETMNLAAFISDPQANILFCNGFLTRLVGMDKERLIGRSWIDLLVVPQERGRAGELFNRILEGRSSAVEITLPLSNPFGIQRNVIWTPIHLQPLSDEPPSVAFIGRDVTGELDLETHLRRIQKWELIGDLAGGLAHDFNNILGAIVGYSELAQRHISDPYQLERCLTQVSAAAERARTLVDQLMSISSRREQQKSVLEMHLPINDAIKLVRNSCPSSIEIKTALDVRSGKVYADPSQIHQLVMNLCTNAVRAMGNQQGVLEVSLTSVEVDHEKATAIPGLKSGPYLELIVRDNGCGMDSETIRKVFNPYFTTKEGEEGAGLGLAIVQKIVQNHDGAIQVTSVPGQGSIFSVFFPRYLEITSSSRLSKTSDIQPGDERILFVDDEPQLLEAYKSLLKSLGYGVTACSDSTEAAQLFWLRPHEYDLIVTDQTMPKMSGIALAKKIHAIRQDIPIILCTGNYDYIDTEKMREAGICHLLSKPLFLKDLSISIRAALEKA